jgi:branched-chain amino acid transport system substrate-binding protein
MTRVGRRQFLRVTSGALAAWPLLRARRAGAAPSAIRIGYTLSATGPYAPGVEMTQGPNNILWAEEVNRKGGLYIKEFDRRIPVERVLYDDRSEPETAVRFYEKLATEDKVDLLLPPWGAAMNFATAPVANKYGYPMVAPTAGSRRIRELALPNFFVAIQQPELQMQALVAYLKDLSGREKIEKVAVLYVADLFGIEYSSALAPLIPVAGFELTEFRSYPLGVRDLSPVLKVIKSKNVDAVIGLTYPPDTILATTQAREIGLNPKLLYLAVGTSYPIFRDRFTTATEGVSGTGAWNPKVPYKGAKEYFAAFVKRWNKEPDRWSGAVAYASLQILEQAVEKAGTLDRKKIRDIIATDEFATIMGPVKFGDGVNRLTPGMVGQWQKGEFEVVWPKDRATAEALYPKPAWK